MPSENHSFGVNSVMQNKPSKKLVLRSTLALPDSTRRMMSGKSAEMLLINKIRSENPFSTIENPGIIAIRMKLKTIQ
jgi:hypothetical protein